METNGCYRYGTLELFVASYLIDKKLESVVENILLVERIDVSFVV